MVVNVNSIKKKTSWAVVILWDVIGDDYVPSISSPASSPRMKNRVKSMRVLHHENFIPPPVERV